MKANWKTTLSGALAALGAYFQTLNNPTFTVIGQVLTIAGTFLLGLTAKDSGGTPPAK